MDTRIHTHSPTWGQHALAVCSGLTAHTFTKLDTLGRVIDNGQGSHTRAAVTEQSISQGRFLRVCVFVYLLGKEREKSLLRGEMSGYVLHLHSSARTYTYTYMSTGTWKYTELCCTPECLTFSSSRAGRGVGERHVCADSYMFLCVFCWVFLPASISRSASPTEHTSLNLFLRAQSNYAAKSLGREWKYIGWLRVVGIAVPTLFNLWSPLTQTSTVPQSLWNLLKLATEYHVCCLTDITSTREEHLKSGHGKYIRKKLHGTFTVPVCTKI